jgi:hypothetical protein
MARKADRLILAISLESYEDHTRQHIEEMKSLVAAARGQG